MSTCFGVDHMLSVKLISAFVVQFSCQKHSRNFLRARKLGSAQFSKKSLYMVQSGSHGPLTGGEMHYFWVMVPKFFLQWDPLFKTLYWDQPSFRRLKKNSFTLPATEASFFILFTVPGCVCVCAFVKILIHQIGTILVMFCSPSKWTDAQLSTHE